MSRQPYYFHVVFWMLLFTVWLVLTTTYHPTWTLRIACTFVLTLMSAVFARCFIPRTANVVSVARAILGLLVCGVGAAIAIHVIYDGLLGPDPRRFAFTSNLMMDTAIVAFNTLVAGFFASIVRKLTGRPTWFLR